MSVFSVFSSGAGHSGQGRSGQGHSGQWPEIFFTGLNDFGHSGLSNLILHFSCKSFTEGKLSG